ncbi:hypothetical protein [Salmonella enterica]|uniref:hypothetical protein n=1 Tax=Salmonella enterica TaxID=28901 RepID=UPI0012F41B63|nr:hypothetical protein [Salmonella enterica]EBU7766774.1 hypothetical protein [Salmonella enterica subsp. enterica serovar Rovaniemi]EBX3140779.1 hypothetical protein [Salmonella enterica subsp. enterica serovar Ealing]EHQ0665641.1 hypothetical protein [Salmonella enterica subsp. enterica serovar Oranienburg]MBH0429210.1 hypothetical protein [Salmonella enterica]HDH3765918.1 hypothetical protein [Salmonella enterica subsp. enterica serovar Oranienburg]
MKGLSAKDLLNKHSSPLNAASLLNAMLLAGLLEEKEYISSTGSGEIKSYRSLTEAGLKYGMNKKSGYSEATELRFFPSTFSELLVVVSKEILRHSEALYI